MSLHASAFALYTLTTLAQALHTALSPGKAGPGSNGSAAVEAYLELSPGAVRRQSSYEAPPKQQAAISQVAGRNEAQQQEGQVGGRSSGAAAPRSGQWAVPGEGALEAVIQQCRRNPQGTLDDVAGLA